MPVGVVHVSLRDLGADQVELRYWRDNPNEFNPRTLHVGEIADLTRKAEADYYAIGEPDLVEIGKRLFRWLDGTDAWLRGQLGSFGAGPVALLIEVGQTLGHLPWEVLHDGTAFLVRGARPAVLPVRWRRTTPIAVPTRPRPLNVLFMATSPLGVSPELNYEEEEGRILQATEAYPLALTVEETGTLDELRDLVNVYPEGYFDVLHLTGHADHRPDGPRFLTESPTGEAAWVSAAQIADAVPRRPALTFLSGCKTAQSPKGGAVPSLAEALLAEGFPAVLGWGRPVFDSDAIIAAAAIYDRLAAGYGPVEALLHAHTEMLKAKARHWHLLRLFVAGGLPPAPVTAKTLRQARPPMVSHGRWFLDDKRLNAGGAVVDRKDFVGRRRPLQRFIRALRADEWPAGVVVYGIGGVGKSSLACRILDRLGESFATAVHVGLLDEPGLLRSLETIPDMNGVQRSALQAGTEPLGFRLRDFLNLRAGAGLKPLLLVLDDFEQNLPPTDGTPLITPTAQDVMEALVWAVEESRADRILVTSRYKLTTTQGAKFFQEQLSAMRPAEADKKRRGLENYRGASDAFKERLDRVADGNPRLMERLDLVLKDKSLDLAALIARMEAVATEFREQVLVAGLAAGLAEPTRKLLAGLLIYEQPVPFEAIPPLFPDRTEADLRASLAAASVVGLLEDEPQPSVPHYRVPRLLQPVLAADSPADPAPLVNAAASTLFKLWWERGSATEPEGLEIARLGCLARRADIAAPITATLGWGWIRQYRYREARNLYEATIAAIGRDYRLVGGLGEVETTLGDGERAHQLLEEALKSCPAEDDDSKLLFLNPLSQLLIQLGQPAEALRLLREEQLPAAERLKQDGSRAVTLGKIADVLAARGETDEALRIRREEELPVYERLGDVRSRAITLGLIADVLAARGETDEALKVFREELIPTFERLGDVRSRAVALGRIADVLAARGETDEALRIRREEQLPVYERLGEVRERAISLGKIADILAARGETDEALRIRREEELPVYERLGDVRSRAVTLGLIADVLAARGETDEALRIRREEQLPVFERLGDVRERAVALGRIADVLAARGETDEALRIRREEELPVYERLGDVRSRAITLGLIADVLAARGETDEALKVFREELIPTFERLGDVRSRAITLGLIADVLAARGETDEALRIRREEELPVYERLGDVRSRAITLGLIADVLAARGETDEALKVFREELIPTFERLGDVRSRAVALGRIADLLAARGETDEALRIRREEELPVFERLGEVRERAISLGKIADILAARGETDEALRILRDESLPTFRKLDEPRSLANTLISLGVYSLKSERAEDGVRYLAEALPFAVRAGDTETVEMLQQFFRRNAPEDE